jgi:hypothetical protein
MTHALLSLLQTVVKAVKKIPKINIELLKYRIDFPVLKIAVPCRCSPQRSSQQRLIERSKAEQRLETSHKPIRSNIN